MAKKIVLTDNSGNKCYPVTRDECVKCGDRTLSEKFSELDSLANRTTPAFSFENDFVNISGQLQSNTIFGHTNTIDMKKGQTVVVKGYATTNISVISKVVDDGYEILIRGDERTNYYAFSAIEDIQIVISCRKTEPNPIIQLLDISNSDLFNQLEKLLNSKISEVVPKSFIKQTTGTNTQYVMSQKGVTDELEFIKNDINSALIYNNEEITNNEGSYISNSGEIKTAAAAYYTNPINIKKGETVYIKGRASSNMALLSMFQEGKYIQLLRGFSDFEMLNEASYYAQQDMQIVISAFIDEKTVIRIFRFNEKENIENVESLIDVDFIIGQTTWETGVIPKTTENTWFSSKPIIAQGDFNININDTEGLLSVVDVYGFKYDKYSDKILTANLNGLTKLSVDAKFGYIILTGRKKDTTVISDDDLLKISKIINLSHISNLNIDDIIKSEDILGNTKSSIKNLLPRMYGDEKTVYASYINSIDTPNQMLFGWEYLQHWYEKIYDAKQIAKICNGGDSITEGYDVSFNDTPVSFIAMRNHMIK